MLTMIPGQFKKRKKTPDANLGHFRQKFKRRLLWARETFLDAVFGYIKC